MVVHLPARLTEDKNLSPIYFLISSCWLWVGFARRLAIRNSTFYSSVLIPNSKRPANLARTLTGVRLNQELYSVFELNWRRISNVLPWNMPSAWFHDCLDSSSRHGVSIHLMYRCTLAAFLHTCGICPRRKLIYSHDRQSFQTDRIRVHIY